MKKLSVFLVVFSFIIGNSFANIRLPGIFSDNMVLQRRMKVPVWGWADPGEKVVAGLGGHVAETVTNPDGRWELYLGPLDSGGPFNFIIAGKDSVIIKNVLVGEVWVCSGQSNMAMEVRRSLDAQQEIGMADYPDIRFFQVKRVKAALPLEDVSPVDDSKANWLNKWQVCSPSTVGHFTAVGYFFGRNLYEKLGVPVGLISASWGGTTAEAWTPLDTLENDPELSLIMNNWPDYNSDEEWLRGKYEKYVKAVAKAKKEGDTLPLYFNQPTVLYNGIIAPIIPFGIRGVTWYQGESNAYRAYQYRRLFPAMIGQWRKNWGQGDFPFLFVQLANYHFEPQVFPELREAQSMALSVPNTAMAVAIDVGDSADIHPKNKQEVGRRLSLAARRLVYGEELIYSGPVYKSMHIENGKCYLGFNHTGGGLVAKGHLPLKGFVIAGTDKVFVEAQAKVEGGRVVVWSGKISQPVAVRYAWANHPGGCNLYNKSGELPNLPASPFRTDDWKGITWGRE
ncbi:Sialic acid-specific 9-O-acetylesterase [hydrothermal vent metagenome]|uniref:Sialic acid-specific 9-O-acetylesterase n=1 Tax=hydrothermal vent metagenome TaxID=652676 RepID=A0A3B0U2J2_9ZZZZ